MSGFYPIPLVVACFVAALLLRPWAGDWCAPDRWSLRGYSWFIFATFGAFLLIDTLWLAVLAALGAIAVIEIQYQLCAYHLRTGRSTAAKSKSSEESSPETSDNPRTIILTDRSQFKATQ